MSIASQAHYARLQSAEGRALREFLNGAVKRDPRHLPGRRELMAEAEAVAQAVPGTDPKALVAAYTRYARHATSGSMSPFELRGHIDQTASAVVEGLEKANRLVDYEDEAVDAAALATAAIDSTHTDARVRDMGAGVGIENHR